MTDHGPRQLPPAHRAARLTILLALAVALVVGLLPVGLADGAGAVWQWIVDSVGELLTSLR